ncbi:LysR family transcriptional regulator [Ensifer sp. B1-9]|uniref:LysR family transcriptional regulator n=1 Tax=Ensifer sp. B1-9 TaxID=3141455 RepID=UPI003D195441
MDDTTINLRQLRYFATVVEIGSMSGAAQRLGLAQTAISLQIRDLERAVGVKLLDRHSRGVAPTAAGQVLFERFHQIERLLGQALSEVRLAGQASIRPFLIGLTPSHMRLVGADILLSASQRLGSIQVKLVEELSYALVGAVRRGELDLAFAYDVEPRAGLTREAVIEDELLFVTTPENSTGDGPISFSDALAHELFFAGEKGIVAFVRTTAQQMELEPKIRSDMQSVPAIRSRIAEGGASLLPYGTVADGVKRRLFAIRRVEQPVLSRTLYMIRRSEERSPLDDVALAPFVHEVVQHMCAAAKPYARIIDKRFDVGRFEIGNAGTP